MHVIAVLNQKGGAGKTTIATNLARAFQLAGQDTLLVDSDPQGSARDWSEARPDNPLIAVGLDRPGILERDLKSVTNKSVIVIDGAPQVRELATAAIKVANFILIPVQPSPYDVWAASDLVSLVKSRVEITDGLLKAAFVVSRAIEGTKIGREVLGALHEYELPVLDSRVTQRVVFATSATSGLSVMDAEPSGKAAQEIMALQGEIMAILAGEKQLSVCANAHRIN